MGLTPTIVEQYLPQILAAIPEEWRGTTFKNSALLGREVFSEKLTNLILSKSEGGDKISTDDLVAIGNAEDYLRVASNISTTLELILAELATHPITQVFAFASTTMPVIAAVLTSKGRQVHLYTGDECTKSPFTPSQLNLLSLLGGNLVWHAGSPKAHPNDVVLAYKSVLTTESSAGVDGLIAPNVLYILEPSKLVPGDILVIRKRMATPPTTPMAEAILQEIAKVPVTANRQTASPEDIAEFYAHLQTLSGTPINADANPLVFTAGLSSLCTLFMTLIHQGGAEILMCSTAYGGSSQQVDLLCEKAGTLHKSTFDIQGGADITRSIKEALDRLASNHTAVPSTVLLVEIPTNPDMKVPDISAVTACLQAYQDATQKNVLFVIDTTFAPNSQVLSKIREASPSLAAMTWISMSKSVSRGLTTAGCMVANHTTYAKDLIGALQETGKLVDTIAKPDQMNFLIGAHKGVEKRCENAYSNAAMIGKVLQQAVKKYCSYDMALAFVAPEHAAVGYTTSTFSFNLPSPLGGSEEVCEALAQRFVDLICAHPEFKPCVSFGQDNGLVYATVPATSTQGAIKAEDKAKQAVGGVQLTRLSFPPTCDTKAIGIIMTEAIAKIYS
eukprot:GFUD01044144.1.p1 GENE.GFUD01044144.1~~GFUD01044144.1.p1  ORF type:complete len:616 (-),score=98.67 GFUD01044144.1:188-2035(-)